MNSKSKKIAFLFGSGVSIPAGMPSTNEITKRVLSGEKIKYRPTIFSEENNVDDGVGFFYKGVVPRVVKFLDRIGREVDHFYKQKPFKLDWNYEDLYYVVSQIRDSEKGEFENPAIQPLIDRIMPDISESLIGKPGESEREWDLKDLAQKACEYIEDLVYAMLKKRPEKLDHLYFLYECFMDQAIFSADIFTLNHDSVIESFCLEYDLKYTDGFEDKYTDIRVWNPNLLRSADVKFTLVKLHGGRDWKRIRREIEEEADWHEDFIGIPKNQYAFMLLNRTDNISYRIYERPIILVGTYNKMLDYVGGIYDDLFFYFYKGLREIDTLIISGYSFGDRGINTKIIDWIYLSYDHKLLVIHPEPEELKWRSKGSIRNKWEGWIDQNKLKLIPKPIQNANWEDIKSLL